MKVEVEVAIKKTVKENEKDFCLEPYLFPLDELRTFAILNIAPTEHIQIFREGNKDNIGKSLYCYMTINEICDYVESLGMNYYKKFIDDMIEELQRRKKWAE